MSLAADDGAGDGGFGLIGFRVTQKECHGRTLFAGQLFGCSGGNAESDAGVEFFTLAQANNQQVTGGDARRGEQRRQFVEFAG